MRTIVAIAALTVAVMLPGRASAASSCKSSKSGGKVTVSCIVRNVHSISIHLTSTTTGNTFFWSLDCGGDEPALAAQKTVGRHYYMRIDGRSPFHQMISTHKCTVTASGQLTHAGHISVRITAA